VGILFELSKTNKAAIYLYSLNDQHNLLDEIKGKYPNDHSVLFRNIEILAERGEIRDEDKFKHIQNSIFEFKTKKLRVFCLLLKGVRPKTFILNHYYKKQGQKTPTKEINKAQRIADEIIEKHKTGELKFGG
jgi:hypothetical protein